MPQAADTPNGNNADATASASTRARLASAAHGAAISAYTSSSIRRAMPITPTFRMIDAGARLARRRRLGVWQENVAFHRELLRYTPLRGREEDVATDAIAEFLKIMEIFWRPWLMRAGEVADIDNYRSAAAAGRSVLLVFPHFGLTYAAAPTLHRHGIDTYTVLSPHHHEATGDSYPARQARRAHEYVEELGRGHGMAGKGGTVRAEGTFAKMQELLEAGETVAIAWTWPGSMPTPFLGRRLGLASGPAKLSVGTGAIVVPFVNQRREATPILRFGAPIDPHDYADAEALQAAIARQYETWALQYPEAVWPLGTQKSGPPLLNGPAIEPEPAASTAG